MQKSLLILLLACCASSAHAFNILVDFTYDTNSFFNTAERQAAMQAVADRFARVISSPLQAFDANYMSGNTDWRIGFTHPGLGTSYQISTASSQATDGRSTPANEYDASFTLPADTWILFPGGRPALGAAGVGGTGTGLNLTSVFNDVNGPLHRGVISNTPANTVNDLPAWGGAVAFNTDLNWHFDLTSAAPLNMTDFYSIALHEVGHALGLSASWNQWQRTGATYTGANAIAAYNADNGTSVASLSLQASDDPHWLDNTYDSFIFTLGNPNLVGTVGLATLQDLLMEPTANFTGAQQRFELTNAEAAALRDIGWSVIPEPSSAVLLIAGIAALSTRRKR